MTESQPKTTATNKEKIAAILVEKHVEARTVELENEIARLAKGSPAPAKVQVSETRIRVAIGETTLTSKVIDGTFPDYGRVIPQDHAFTATLDRAALAASSAASPNSWRRTTYTSSAPATPRRGSLNSNGGYSPSAI